MKGWMLIAGAGVVIVIAAALYWFQPQALVIDKKVDEAVPTAEADRGTDSDVEEPEAISEGEFRPLAHEVSGRVVLLQAGDRRFVRFEDFEVENGPDLRVYASEATGDDPGEAFVDLGALKGNVGAQNYELPASLDPSSVNTVFVWCRRFSVGFAVAEMS